MLFLDIEFIEDYPHYCTYIQLRTQLFTHFSTYVYTRTHNPTCNRKSSAVHVFHGVPEAPCVGPKYYTQTVAITSKPKIPHSTFLIPAARLLSWAPHEEPLLEREGSCISLALCLSVYLQPSFSLSVCPSAHVSLTVIVSVCDSLAPSIFLFLPLLVYLYLSYLFLLSSAVLCRPLSHSVFLPSCICLFISFYTLLSLLSPTDAVCLWPSFSLQDSYFAFCLFSFVSLSVSCCLSLRLPLPLCLQIFMQRFSHMLDIDL